MARWRERGYVVARSAGSHGVWDVCAVKGNRAVELIQCKVVSNQAESDRLIREFTKNPPLAPSEQYHLVLEIKIKGSKEIRSVTV